MDRNRRGVRRERGDDAGAEFRLGERERLRRRGADGAAIAQRDDDSPSSLIAQRDDDSPSSFAGLGMRLSPDILGGNNASAVANAIPEDSSMGDFAGVYVSVPPQRSPRTTRTNRFNFDDAVVEPLLVAARNREFSVRDVADNEVFDALVMALPPHAQPAVLTSGSNTHSMGNDGFVLPTRAPLSSVTISSSDAAARSAPKIAIPNASPKNPFGVNGLGGGPRSSESSRGGGTA